MIEKEFNFRARVYKVQAFGTTHLPGLWKTLKYWRIVDLDIPHRDI